MVQEMEVVKDLASYFVHNGYGIRYEVPVQSVYYDLIDAPIPSSGVRDNHMRVDLLVWLVNAYRPRFTAIEVKTGYDWATIYQGLGQTMIYSAYFPSTWLATGTRAIRKLRSYLGAIPVHVLDYNSKVLYIRSRKYDALRYLRGDRVETK